MSVELAAQPPDLRILGPHSGLNIPGSRVFFTLDGSQGSTSTTTILSVIGPSLGLYYSIAGTTRWNDCSAIAMEGADVFWKLCCIPLSCTPSRLSGSIRGAWYGTPWLHSSSCARMDCLAPQVWPRASNTCEPLRTPPQRPLNWAAKVHW